MEKELKKIRKEWILYCLLAIIIIISILPLFKEGIAETDDFRQHIAAFWWIKYSFVHYGKFTEWMPYIYSGWPLTHFYHSLPYFASLPIILLMKPAVALKASIAESFILAAIAMFFAVNKLTKRKDIAAIAATLYTFMPIHFEFLYVAGSISRLWACIFMPLVFAYFIFLMEEGGKKNAVLTGIFYAALAWSHLYITVVVSYFLTMYLFYHVFIQEKKIKISTLKELSLAAVIAIGLLAFWLVPFVMENHDSTAAGIQKIFGGFPESVRISQIFVRNFGRDANEQGMFYISYALLGTTILGLLTMPFREKKIYSVFIFLGILLTIYTEPLKLIPLGGSVSLSTHFLFVAAFFMCIVAAMFIAKKINRKKSMLIGITLLVLFVIDVYPAHNSFRWTWQNAGMYTNTPEIIDVFSFVRQQPGLFRTYTLIGELPFIYTEHQEIGTIWTGYREGAFKPIRDLTDNIFHEFPANATFRELGYMGTKYIIMPCIKDFDKLMPLAYGNKGVCVYENPLFRPVIESPCSVEIAETPTVQADAHILESCVTNCVIQRPSAKISGTIFEPEHISFATTSKDSAFIVVKVSYFRPHWHAYIDGQETKIRKAWPYYMLIEVPQGKHNVEFKYKTNSTHIIGFIVTIATVISIILMLIRKRLLKKKHIASCNP